MTCYCQKHTRWKHNSLICPECGVQVRLSGWTNEQYAREKEKQADRERRFTVAQQLRSIANSVYP